MRLIKYLLLTCLLLVILTLAGVFLLLQEHPLTSNSHQQLNDADTVHLLMEEIRAALRSKQPQHQINLSQAQLNSLFGFASRAHNRLSGVASIEPQQTIIRTSYRLPKSPFGQYLNLQVGFLPGNQLQLDTIQLGGISLPGQAGLNILVWFADWYLGAPLLEELLKHVQQVSMREQQLNIKLTSVPEILAKLNTLKTQLGNKNEHELRKQVAYYLAFLDRQPVQLNSSLANTLSPLFHEVEQRSNRLTAAIENEAAILALAIYAGNYRFANFIGDVQPRPGEIAKPLVRPTLAGRQDLSLHFIYSAAIELLSAQGISSAIGEFKELMDRRKQGSGYSFADLAADMAGVQFAQLATNPDSARAVQQLLVQQRDESLYFPDINDLPEGLDKQAFEQTYGQVDSPAYQLAVSKIKYDLVGLPIYQATLTD